MTTLYQDIRGLLQRRAMTAVGFPADIAPQAVAYNPVPGTPWARMVLTPASGRPFSVSGARIKHVGLFTVTIFQPAKAGTAAAEVAADNLKAVFRPGDVLHRNNENLAVDYAEVRQIVEETDWVSAPVMIGWTCYSPRN